MQQADEAVPVSDLLHDIHRQLVLVAGCVAVLVVLEKREREKEGA